MATDYSILEEELIETKRNLKRELHMHMVRRLCKKQSDLAKFVIQRKQIENLSKQLAEIEPTVSTLYCRKHALEDNEIMGYLVYLLKMKDFFTREVETKEGMIKQMEVQIKAMSRKLCSIVNEQAKLKKAVPVKTPELENMSSRMNQMNIRICTMRNENRGIMENIMNMIKFQRQYRVFEKDFRRKINYFKDEAQGLLDKAVYAYEEKDEFTNKAKVFEERRAQDERKTAINENSLDLCIMRTDNNEAFEKLQNIVRTDIRISETSEMIETGVTGLEANLEKMRELQTAITAAAQENTPQKMEENFKEAGDNIDVLFSYLDQLLREIHQLQREINVTKEENRLLIKNVSSSDSKFRENIAANQDKAQRKLEKADESTKKADEAKSELNSSIDIVKKLYIKCCPDDAMTLEKKPIDKSNVIDYLQSMEKQLLDYLICLEYIRMKEASKEEKKIIIEEDDDNKDIDEHMKKKEDLHVVQPRELSYKSDIQALEELDAEKSFLDFEELKKKAMAVIAEIQSEKSEESVHDES